MSINALYIGCVLCCIIASAAVMWLVIAPELNLSHTTWIGVLVFVAAYTIGILFNLAIPQPPLANTAISVIG